MSRVLRNEDKRTKIRITLHDPLLNIPYFARSKLFDYQNTKLGNGNVQTSLDVSFNTFDVANHRMTDEVRRMSSISSDALASVVLFSNASKTNDDESGKKSPVSKIEIQTRRLDEIQLV